MFVQSLIQTLLLQSLIQTMLLQMRSLLQNDVPAPDASMSLLHRRAAAPPLPEGAIAAAGYFLSNR